MRKRAATEIGSNGFSLIEIVVVVAIIGIISFASYSVLNIGSAIDSKKRVAAFLQVERSYFLQQGEFWSASACPVSPSTLCGGGGAVRRCDNTIAVATISLAGLPVNFFENHRFEVCQTTMLPSSPFRPIYGMIAIAAGRVNANGNYVPVQYNADGVTAYQFSKAVKIPAVSQSVYEDNGEFLIEIE